ncbi:hypothetical protein [Kocuria salsicia]|uniref:hypothetical protein n=1 Tax=Kocuria salsicia TaxID=664639 RepID=UPI0021B52215|nr:hypothetical protein [Kocuria salsicia]
MSTPEHSPRPPMLRSLAAALCALLAGAGFALWLGISWLQDHVLSPSGFQDTAASVVTQTSFQEDLVSTLVDQATLHAGDTPGTGIDALDGVLQRVRDSAVSAAQQWLTAPEQEGTWIQVLDDTHDANVPVTASAGKAPDEFVVDVSALGAAVEQQVEKTVGFSPGIADQNLTITVPGAHTGVVVDTLVQLAQWRYALPWFAGILAVLALVVAPRRWLALAGVGLSGVLFTGVVLAVALSSAQKLVDASAVEPVAHVVTEQIVAQLRESFVTSSVTGMLGAGAVALFGVILAVVRPRAVTYHKRHVHSG